MKSVYVFSLLLVYTRLVSTMRTALEEIQSNEILNKVLFYTGKVRIALKSVGFLKKSQIEIKNMTKTAHDYSFVDQVTL